jgi:hypothetical protein
MDRCVISVALRVTGTVAHGHHKLPADLISGDGQRWLDPPTSATWDGTVTQAKRDVDAGEIRTRIRVRS